MNILKNLSLLILALSLYIQSCSTEKSSSFQDNFITSDINNFWIAYEAVLSAQDSTGKAEAFKSLYLEKGSPGLADLQEVRGYTIAEYLDAIRNYPKFWESMRDNISVDKIDFDAIQKDINQLRDIYPELSPADLYFSVGAFRTNGTVKGKNILIGTELSLADKETVIDELPEWRQPYYKEYNPIKALPLLCTHEYIHTQQAPIQENLAAMIMYEGVAEFLSCYATEKPSDSPAIEFGKANKEKVSELFLKDLFSGANPYNWMWGQNRNELKVRDLGYYVGYAICEGYLKQAKDEKTAVKELIELDLADPAAIRRVIDASGYFFKPLEELEKDYESIRPEVISMEPFANGSTGIKPGKINLSVQFSEPLTGIHTGIDYSPKGADFCPKMDYTKRTWAEDNTSYTFEVDLEAGKEYEFVLTQNFQ